MQKILIKHCVMPVDRAFVKNDGPKKWPKGPSAPDSEPLSQEVETLLSQILVEEANQAVWQKFESALGHYDDAHLELFEQYLDGVTIEELSRERNLSPDKLEQWIKNLKKELIQTLKTEISVRN